MKLTPAPAALLRACATPIEALDAFGTGAGDAPRGDAAYREVRDREREALWERTVGEPRFMKALAFSTPELAERVGRLAGKRAERNKRVRHAETSLYRYLSRAASRTTPAGLWAGIGLARFGAEDRVVSLAPRHAIAPDLGPFAAALQALGRRVPYRERARFRLNPTVRRRADGQFALSVRLPNGTLEQRGLEATTGLEPLLGRLGALGARTLGELASGSGVNQPTTEALADAGVLVSGFALPSWFESPWDALEVAAELLSSDERASWVKAVAELGALAATLATELDRLAVSDVLGALARARSVVVELARRLGVSVEIPRAVLRCDLGLPFEVVLGDGWRGELARTLDTYHREWLDAGSPSSRARAERRAALVRALATRPAALGEEWLVDAPEGGHRSPATGSAASARAPWGCLFARLGAQGLSTVFGVDDNPARAFARYADLLGRKNELCGWLAARVAELSRDHGVITGDLAVPFEGRPNVLARANVGALRIEPWGTTGPSLLGAELRSEGGAVVLQVPGVGRLVVVTLCAAYVLTDDPVAAQLLSTGFEEPTGSSFRASSALTLGEQDTPAHAEPWALSTGAVVRERRTCIAGSHLAPLLACKSASSRWSAWRSFAERLDWPSRITISIDGGPPLFVEASSPLGIEAAFEGAGGARRVLVTDADVGGWLESAAGRHVADIVVPFARSPHAFSSLEPEPTTRRVASGCA